MAKKPNDQALLDRPLPHNLEAERSVLGGILISNALYVKVAGRLRAEHFYRDAHVRVFRALERLLERADGAADFLTLKDELGRAGELDAVGGPAYIASLTDGVPRATNITHYAAIVKQKAQLRQVIRTADGMLHDAYEDTEDPAAILEKADQAIVRLRHGAGSSRMRSLRDSSQELYDDLAWRAEHRGELIGIDTGFASINDLTNGWQKGDLIVVAARPSVGKTTFLLNTALHAARLGKRVVIFSLEMRRKQLEYRLLASISGVDLSRITSGYMSSSDWALVTQAMGELRDLPIFIDDTASRTVGDMRAECRRIQAEGGLDLGVMDYVQLMAADRPNVNRTTEVTEISRRTKVLADELGIPMLIASQLNRSPEARSDPRPRLSDLRESGALEQDADIVCFLHRKHHKENGPTEFIIEKQRNGPTGTVILTVARELVRFTDGGDPLPEDTPEERKAKQVSFFKQRARKRS